MAFAVSKIGLLGSDTSIALGTYTVYTVPASSTAKVKLMWAFLNGGTTSNVEVRVNGINIWSETLTASVDAWTGLLEATGNWSTSDTKIHTGTNKLALLNPNGEAVITEFPFDYYLDAADTVQYEVSTDVIAAAYFAVNGTEFTV